MKSTKLFCFFAVSLLLMVFYLGFAPSRSLAQMSCSFVPVSTPLNDLGTGEYYRLTFTNPFSYQPTGLIGGLYPAGSNVRPVAHEAAGISLAQQIQQLDSNGSPSSTGKIGMVSVGMSNTQSEFGTFISQANADPEVNDNLVIVNGALSGGTIEKWIDPTEPNHEYYWQNLEDRIVAANLTDAQIQVLWVKITQLEKSAFPGNMQNFEARLEVLAGLLKNKFPNLKITYLSSRIRSAAYVSAAVAEPAAFDNAFGIRWLIEKQINGDMTLNYNPNLGPTPVSYLSWGPYLWIDGDNPRSDGRTWPITNLMNDCVHPSPAGNQAVAGMLMEFFKSDTTATPWFLNAGVPVPTPTPTPFPTITPSPMPTPTPTEILTPTPTLEPTPTPTDTPSPTPTQSPSPTPTPPSGGPVSSWGFAQDQVTDDYNGCTGCSNNGAIWQPGSILSGDYFFNGTNSYLNLGTLPYLNGASSFTTSFWIKPGFNQTHTSWRTAISNGTKLSFFYLSNISDWRLYVRTTTKQYRVDTVGLTWESDTWHFVTISYDGVSIKLYWDGILRGSTIATGPLFTDTGASYLGKNIVNSQFFLGEIDELYIYNRALAQEEITGLYQSF